MYGIYQNSFSCHRPGDVPVYRWYVFQISSLISIKFKGFLILDFCIVGVLENGIEDFQTGEEIYEAIGEVLLQLDDTKSESDIK